jgi:hypothetical protein
MACDLASELPASDGSTANTPAPTRDAESNAPREAGPPADAETAEAAPPETKSDSGVTSDAGKPDRGARESGAALDASPESAPDAAVGQADAGGDGALRALPFPPLETAGVPLTAPDRTWTYFEFSDTKCRDGSPAGVSINLNKASKKLMIYLEGAAYCFEGFTCLLNAEKVEDGLYNSAKEGPKAGIFDLDNAQNPVRDWNIVYVPNCSGDGHGGTQMKATDVPDGPRGQYFVGQLNLQRFLQRIVPSFPDVSDVLLTGISSGGFGVLQNLVLVQRAFPALRVRYVNDSNPPLSKTVVAECLQEKMRTLWGLDQGALAYCSDSCAKKNDYLEDNAVFLAKLFADRPGGYIEALNDSLMINMFGLGNNNCTGTFLLDSVPADSFRAALLTYRDKLKSLPHYGTFFPEATDHTWLSNDAFYTIRAGGISLVDWFGKIARGEAPGHAGPP